MCSGLRFLLRSHRDDSPSYFTQGCKNTHLTIPRRLFCAWIVTDYHLRSNHTTGLFLIFKSSLLCSVTVCVWCVCERRAYAMVHVCLEVNFQVSLHSKVWTASPWPGQPFLRPLSCWIPVSSLFAIKSLNSLQRWVQSKPSNCPRGLKVTNSTEPFLYCSQMAILTFG